jgi:phosphate starvation-inducible protein PhoH and related proteins
MARTTKTRKSNRKQASYAIPEDPVVTHHIPKRNAPATRPVEPKTQLQSEYMHAIATKDVVFGLGPAGTGKTYLACALAAQALADKRTSKIIVTRPAVEAGEQMGFLPGELDEKYEPYLQPVRQVFTERLGKGPFEYFLKNGDIEPIPLGFMRGMTFNDCWVILDEAQNVTPAQMKMFLTRIGENCKVIICGDSDQVDIAGASGLDDAVRRTSWSPYFSQVEFGLEDVVRSGVVLDVLKSYSKSGAPAKASRGAKAASLLGQA